MFSEIMLTSRSVARLYNEIMSEVRKKHELTQFEVDVLGFLHNHPTLDTASHIVEYRMLPKASVSQAVDTLARRGMLAQQRDADDRRKVHLVPTQRACAAIDDIIATQKRFVQIIFGDFSKADMDMLSA